MKNNKLHLTIFSFILTAAFNIANAQTKVGIKAGVNFSNVVMKDENGSKQNTQSTPAFC